MCSGNEAYASSPEPDLLSHQIPACLIIYARMLSFERIVRGQIIDLKIAPCSLSKARTSLALPKDCKTKLFHFDIGASW